MMSRAIIINLFSCQPVGSTQFHGGGEYIKSVLKRLTERGLESSVQLDVIYNPDLFLDSWICELIEEVGAKTHFVFRYDQISDVLKSVNSQESVFLEGNITERTGRYSIPAQMKSIGVFHGPRWMELYPQSDASYYSDDIRKKTKAVLKYLARNKYNGYKIRQFDSIFKQFDILVAASVHSKYSLKTFYPNIDEDSIMVFYTPPKVHAGDDNYKEMLEMPYILMMGANRSEKNVFRGMVACDELFSSGLIENYKVVVVGGISNSIRKRMKNPNKFVFYDYLPDDQLESLYRYADIFLYPTLNEGFGLPPIEAMRHNRTCIVSSVTSLTEIYKESVYYCMPTSISEIKTRVLQASKEKIDEDIIRTHYERIMSMQLAGLDGICELLEKGQ